MEKVVFLIQILFTDRLQVIALLIIGVLAHCTSMFCI